MLLPIQMTHEYPCPMRRLGILALTACALLGCQPDGVAERSKPVTERAVQEAFADLVPEPARGQFALDAVRVGLPNTDFWNQTLADPFSQEAEWAKPTGKAERENLRLELADWRQRVKLGGPAYTGPPEDVGRFFQAYISAHVVFSRLELLDGRVQPAVDMAAMALRDSWQGFVTRSGFDGADLMPAFLIAIENARSLCADSRVTATQIEQLENVLDPASCRKVVSSKFGTHVQANEVPRLSVLCGTDKYLPTCTALIAKMGDPQPTNEALDSLLGNRHNVFDPAATVELAHKWAVAYQAAAAGPWTGIETIEVDRDKLLNDHWTLDPFSTPVEVWNLASMHDGMEEWPNNVGVLYAHDLSAIYGPMLESLALVDLAKASLALTLESFRIGKQGSKLSTANSVGKNVAWALKDALTGKEFEVDWAGRRLRSKGLEVSERFVLLQSHASAGTGF